MRNYYKILEAAPGDNADQLKQKYRKLAKKYHPDLNPGDKAAENRFKEINEAWETLGDPEKRKNYDAQLTGESEKRQAQPGTRPTATRSTRTAPTGQAGYEQIMRQFGSFFSEENIAKPTQRKNQEKNPIDTSEMFKRFMGFK